MVPAAVGHPHRVLIAGCGVAGLEALLALHTLAGDRVAVTVAAPDETFTLQALSVLDPFGPAEPRRYSVRRICEEHRARFVHAGLERVDAEGRTARLADGTSVPFDALLVALGARPVPVFAEATTFRGGRDATAIERVVSAVVHGRARRVAFVIPTGTTWALPLYELALLTAERGRALELGGLELTLVTPEPAPLDVFGPEASRATAAALEQAGVRLIVDAQITSVDDGRIVGHRAGEALTVEAEHVIALPRLEGPAPDGVPHDEAGFVPIDEHAAVPGADGVFAAGDCTAFPVKQGGISAQQADVAAHAIARRAGAEVDALAFHPVLRGRLLTGTGSRYLRRALAQTGAEGSLATTHALWWPPSKVAAPYLSPYLERIDLRDEAATGGAPMGVEELELIARPRTVPRTGAGGPRSEHLAYEVPRARWAGYLDELSAERVHAPTIVRVRGADDRTVAEIRDMRLQAMVYDARDDVLIITVARPQPDQPQVVRHVVDHPARLLVDSRAGVLPQAIAVDDVDGTRTFVELGAEPSFAG